MPRPTTRYARYLWQRKRFQRRAKRKWRNQNNTAKRGLVRVPVGRGWDFWWGGLQMGPHVYDHEANLHRLPPYWDNIVQYQVVAPNGSQPARVRRTWAGFPWNSIFPTKHSRDAMVGYHFRRVQAWGHKIDRLNGYQRQIWMANVTFRTESYFPDWDPLQRHPTLQDLEDSGSMPQFSGVWPHVPRPWPTGP